jgi:hypothetical protein
MATKNVESVSGLVEQINPKQTGLKVAGEWLNVSQYHPLAELPTPGQRVDLQIERTDRGARGSTLSRSWTTARCIRCRNVASAAAGRSRTRATSDAWLCSKPQPRLAPAGPNEVGRRAEGC